MIRLVDRDNVYYWISILVLGFVCLALLFNVGSVASDCKAFYRAELQSCYDAYGVDVEPVGYYNYSGSDVPVWVS